MQQPRVTCPTCEKQVTTTRTAMKCEDGRWHGITMTRSHKSQNTGESYWEKGRCVGGIISVDLEAN